MEARLLEEFRPVLYSKFPDIVLSIEVELAGPYDFDVVFEVALIEYACAACSYDDPHYDDAHAVEHTQEADLSKSSVATLRSLATREKSLVDYHASHKHIQLNKKQVFSGKALQRLPTAKELEFGIEHVLRYGRAPEYEQETACLLQ